MTEFSKKVLHWFDQHGRKDLPWQRDINPYRVWVSEIMLQQTQVKTVIPYYETFMRSFPGVIELANASQDQVLKHWSGLGYYARARNMQKAARLIRDQFAGQFPERVDEMQSLPGIGRSTAGAILSIACQQSHPILDGNVKRVLTRFYALEGWTGKAAVLKQLWELAEQNLPCVSAKLSPRQAKQRNADYTQAMMDLGATLCTRSRPQCGICPLNTDCVALKQGNVRDYPTPKPRKVLPVKQAVMLILENTQNEIYMQKRPPLGIWGGLWCFPQFDHLHEAKHWLSVTTDNDWEHTRALDPFNHVFSHFKLEIKAFRLCLNNQNQTPLKLGVMEDDNELWYNLSTEFNGGLAAPVTKLLNTLKQVERT